MIRGLWTGSAVGFVVGYTAVRLRTAWLDRRTPFPTIAQTDPKAYGAVRRGLLVAGTVRSIASLVISADVVAPAVERALRPWPRSLAVPAFIVALSALESLRDLSVDYVEGHVLERTYGTSDQSATDWAADHAKGAAVGIAV